MAISRGDVVLWKQLKARDAIPFRPSVLEIGEANWFGDFPVAEVPGMDASGDIFALGKAFYRATLDYSKIVSIDFNGTPAALKYDLNHPLPSSLGLFDVVINTGTVEHVFDQRTLFESIHNRTKPGGLMVHVFPVAGCTDHGFYTYSPCLIRELDRANGYECLAVCEVVCGEDKLVYIAWRKPAESRPFANPQQGESRGILGGEFTEQFA